MRNLRRLSRLLLLCATAVSMLAPLCLGRGMVASSDIHSNHERDLERSEATSASQLPLARVATSPGLQHAMLGFCSDSHSSLLL